VTKATLTLVTMIGIHNQMR